MNSPTKNLTNFINTIPKDLLASEDTRQMALDTYYASLANVVANNLSDDQISAVMRGSSGTGNTMKALHAQIPDFSTKLYEEFSRLLGERMESTNE